MTFTKRWYEFLYGWLDPANTEDRPTGAEWREMRRELRQRKDVKGFTHDYRRDRYIRAAAEDFWLALRKGI
jgi:hypothetical protein